jgi:phage recombination protein Bet
MSTENTTPATQDRGRITYQVAGQDITLSYTIVRNFLTKGNGQVTDQDLVQFISICKYNQLNPFLNEAYLVKFGSTPAQMIVSKEALMKRAEACDKYEGMQSGVIIKRGDEVLDLEGTFYLKTDVLLGGWATVYRSDRKFPFVARVSLDEYDKKQSTWNDKKATMIKKTAIVQAMREAFPAQLGAMYTAEERGVVDTDYIDVSDKVAAEIGDKANAGAPMSFDNPPVENSDPPKNPEQGK